VTGTAVDGMHISVQQYSFHCATGLSEVRTTNTSVVFSAGIAQV
jgi:hypothetical protein